MSQHDYDIANQAGSAFRSDLNSALAAIVSNNSGATAPTTTYAYQWWVDTTTGILKQRNAANSAWINILTLSTGGPLGTIANQSITAGNGNTVEATSGPTASPFSYRNKIINGGFNVAQRGTTFTSTTTPANSDDTYLFDRWYLLSDGNDIVDVTQESATVPTNGQYAIKLDVETANKKFGIAQIIEWQNCKGLIGGTATLSFKARTSGASLSNIKAGVIAWSGTADTVTSDIISAWGADGVTPTLIANATFENTPANLSVTGTYATYTISGISIDTASAKNIIVFIWNDDLTTTLGDFLYLTDVQLEPGSAATPLEIRPYEVELSLCQRYYYRVSTSSLDTLMPSGYAVSATAFQGFLQFPTLMRAVPTVFEQSGTASHYIVERAGAGAFTVCSAVPTFGRTSIDSAMVNFTVASGLVNGTAGSTYSNSVATYLGWSAEL